MESTRRMRLILVVIALIMAVGATASLSSSTETGGLQLTTIGPPHRTGQYILADPIAATVSVTITAGSYYYTYGVCSANLGLYGDLNVFEEMQIEGKIRRPQLILIKAEQRPKFSSMVMQSLDSEMNVNEFARDPVLDKSPYNGAFSFDGEEITNYKP